MDSLILPPHLKKAMDPEPGQVRPLAIAVPSHDTVSTNFSMAYAQLFYFCGLHHLPLVQCNYRGSILPKSRNALVEMARTYNASHIMFIDSDISFQKEAVGKLFAHQKPIVGATYPRRSQPHDNLVTPLIQERAEYASGLVPVASMPTGFMLIDMTVFDKLEKPYFQFPVIDGQIVGEDVHFCNAARAAGFEINLDIDVSHDLIHWGENGYKVTSPKEGQSAQEGAAAYERVELNSDIG